MVFRRIDMRRVVSFFIIAWCATVLFAAQYFDSKLANGVPLDARGGNSSDVCSLCLIIEGGNACAGDKANIEDIVLSLLPRGSKNYSYSELRSLEYECIATLDGSSYYDYSVYGFTCLKEDFFTMLDAFEDTFFEPLFMQAEFDVVVNMKKKALTTNNTDPDTRLYRLIRDKVFSNTSYSLSHTLTLDTLPQLTLDAVKSCHKKMLDSSRLHFVISGSVDSSLFKKTKSRLDKRFGKIAKQNTPRATLPNIDLQKVAKTNFVQVEQAGSVAYIGAVYNAPKRDSPDYIPFIIAGQILDTVCFNVIREQEGAVYSTGTGIVGGKKLIGVLEFYRANSGKDIKAATQKALSQFPTGQVLDTLVEAQKNIYINTLFSQATSSSGQIVQLITAIEYLGNFKAYETRVNVIRSVKAQDVEAAFSKYFVGENFAWFCVSDTAHKDSFGL